MFSSFTHVSPAGLWLRRQKLQQRVRGEESPLWKTGAPAGPEPGTLSRSVHVRRHRTEPSPLTFSFLPLISPMRGSWTEKRSLSAPRDLLPGGPRSLRQSSDGFLFALCCKWSVSAQRRWHGSADCGNESLPAQTDTIKLEPELMSPLNKNC